MKIGVYVRKREIDKNHRRRVASLTKGKPSAVAFAGGVNLFRFYQEV
jgi:hypothetical protein